MASEAEVEAAARALVERQIRIERRFDTDPVELERRLPAAVDEVWPDRVKDARAALAAAEKVRGPTLKFTTSEAPPLVVDDDPRTVTPSEDAVIREARRRSGTVVTPDARAQGYRQGVEDAAAWLLTCPPHLSLQEYAQGIRALTGEKG